MSLILDALRKLEREKNAREPGVLVVGSVPWGETSRVKRVALVAGALLALAVAGLAGWLLCRPAAPTSAATPAVAQPPPFAPTPEARPTLNPAPALARPRATAEVPPAPPIRISRPLPAVRERAPVERGSPQQLAPLAEPHPATDAAPAAAPEAATPDVAVGAAPSEAPDQPAEPPQVAPKAPLALPAAGEELRLNAISERDGRPVALINDRLVFEGDSFDGVRVLRIGATEVELELNGERRVLRF